MLIAAEPIDPLAVLDGAPVPPATAPIPAPLPPVAPQEAVKPSGSPAVSPAPQDDPLACGATDLPAATRALTLAPETLATLAAPPSREKRVTLFDLERRYLEIVLVLDEVGAGYDLDEGSIESLAHELVEVQDAVDRKVEGWARWIRSVEADAETAKAEAKRLAARGSSFEKLADKLRESLKGAMIAMDTAKVKTALFTVSVKKAPAAVASVDVPNLPTRFMNPPAPPEPNKRAILEEWKRTKVAPPGVTIREDGRTLEIR